VVATTSTSDFDFTLDMLKLTSDASGTSPFPTVGAGGFLGIAMKGTTTADATSWIDPSGHRILKTHVTSKTNATLNLVFAPGSSLAGSLGPMTVNGDQTIDLLPV
jgi:hypothetical protein